MEGTKQLLGKRIREIRKGKGLSQDQLAEQAGVDPKYLSRVELGKSYPRVEALERIARALHVELRDLFDFTHLEAEVISKEQIGGLLDGADQDRLRLVFKVVKSLVK